MRIAIATSVIRRYRDSALMQSAVRRMGRALARGAYNSDVSQSRIRTNGELWLIRSLTDYWKAQGITPTVFDCGANIGNWAAPMAARNPHAQIHCFEPDPDAFRLLSAAMTGANAHLNAFGLSDSSEDIDLMENSGTESGTASRYRKSGLPDRSMRVQMMRGTDYVKEHGIENINVLKVDVEGMEYQALRGMAELVEEGRIDAIQYEWINIGTIDSPQFKDYLRLLADQYEIGRLYPAGVKFRDWRSVWTRDGIEESKHDGNYVAVSRRCPALMRHLAQR